MPCDDDEHHHKHQHHHCQSATVNTSAPEQSAPLIPTSPAAASTHSHSLDMSPRTAILSLLVLIAIPALIYTFFFTLNCPRIPLRRPRRRSQGAVDCTGGEDAEQAEMASCGAVKYEKGADHEEVYGGECPVCLSAFAEGDLVRRLNACKHSFHVACIDKWLSTQSNCPVCRASVPTPTLAGARRADDDFQQGLPDAASLV